MDKRGFRLRTTAAPALILPILLIPTLFSPHCYAEIPEAFDEQDDRYPEPLEPGKIDLAQEVMTRSVNDAARWLDSFFLDERFIAEEAYTRIRLTPSLFFEEGEAAKFKFRVNAKINVPRFNEKLKLTISGNSDESDDDFRAGTFPDASQNTDDETNIGLQYIFRAKDKINTSLSTGVKLFNEHGVDVFVGPRLRKTFDLDDWQLRATERIRWYTDIGWESLTRFDFERLIHDNLFFRGTVDGRWREEDDGYRYEIRPTLTQRLRSKAAVEYQWNNVFETRPNHRLDEVDFRVRYRQRKWRKWLFFEINPQLAFRNDDEFRPTPGIEFRLEASFGGLEIKRLDRSDD